MPVRSCPTSRNTRMPDKVSVVVIVFALLFASAGAANAETVTIAGSGGMIPLLTALGAAYMKKHPNDEIQCNPNSITQSGGILAAKNGAVDIGMSARSLEVRELSYNIDAYHIADVAADVAVHSNVRVTNITSKQLCAIYSGKITNWRELGGHDAPIVVLTRPESDSTKTAFREGIPCFKELRETPEAINMLKSKNMLSALQRTPDSIGIIDSIVLEQSQGMARPLKLDSRSASAEEVASGRWPVVKRYTLVIEKNRKKAVDRFMRFIRSREGAAIIVKHNGIPVNFSYP
jgi:phosphate transport system substrate-binding protein